MQTNIALALAACCLKLSAYSAEPPADVACRQAVVRAITPAPLRGLLGEEKKQVDLINARARALASAYAAVMDRIVEAGLDPNEFPMHEMSWAAAVAGDAVLVGVYRAVSDGRFERTARFGSGDVTDLVERLAAAARVLALTPDACGRSYGALDAGIVDADGRPLIYSLRLTDRRKQIPWGMHYRFAVANGAPQEVEALHFRCATLSTTLGWHERLSERDRAGLLERFPVTEFEIMPDRKLPTEAQIMQFHLDRDLPYTGGIEFVLQGRRMHMDSGATELSAVEREFSNPCGVSEP